VTPQTHSDHIAEIIEALAEVIENPDPHPAIVEALGLDWSRDGFTELFDFDLPPYASYYLSVGPVLGGEPVAFLRDLLANYLPPQVQPAQPDSLAFLLRLVSLLERNDSPQRAMAIVYESLSPWIFTYAQAAQRFAPPGLSPIGRVLQEIYEQWRVELNAASALPYLLRSAPLAAPDTFEAKPLLDYLLSPVMSGLVIPRSELIRSARRHGLGVRPGGRRFSFESLLTTSPSQTLDILLNAVDEQLPWYDEAHDPIACWWSARLKRTASLITDLRAQVDEQQN
jgi:TorA maturation chaperone TorD